jgi:hypothetical protein
LRDRRCWLCEIVATGCTWDPSNQVWHCASGETWCTEHDNEDGFEWCDHDEEEYTWCDAYGDGCIANAITFVPAGVVGGAPEIHDPRRSTCLTDRLIGSLPELPSTIVAGTGGTNRRTGPDRPSAR